VEVLQREGDVVDGAHPVAPGECWGGAVEAVGEGAARHVLQHECASLICKK
jgi:hypothetical protein